MEEMLKNLNEEQIKPVCDTEGAVLVLAGAGSGKTRVLTSRIAYILEQGLSAPEGILAITFTNKAAGEMRERLSGMLESVGGMWICTIHSMCVRILRKYGEALGIDSNFSIYSETERNNVLKKVIRELDLNDEKLLKGAKYHVGNAKNSGLDPDQYLKRNKGEPNIDVMCRIMEGYDERLKSSNAMDFDDLLLQTLRLLKKDEYSRSFLSDRFKYILVDEFQDTNTVQYEIIKLLSRNHGNLFVVGDDDQSIYGWRGAEIKNILQFDKDFPKAKIYKLQRNYRSTGSILNLANVIIKNNGSRRRKTLWTDRGDGEKPEYFQAEDEASEALFAARTISNAVAEGGKYSDFAVLMRINALTRSYEQEFNKYNIPYKVFGGFRFFERKEVKDLLAYMRVISNPFDDEAFTRIINVPRRGIGDRTVEIISQTAREQETGMYYAALRADLLPLPASTQKKVREFAECIKRLVIFSQTERADVIVKEIVSAVDMRSAYLDGTDEGDAKIANMDEFLASVEDFVRLNPQSTLNDYLYSVTLSSDTDELGDGEYVTLATIHSVKGLEFKDVIVCGMEDGIMPTSRADNSPAEMEEERRLMYVAVTRAQDRLYLTRSKSRYLYGRRERTTPSRFIAESYTALQTKQKDEIEGYSARRFNAYGGNYNPYGYKESYGSRSSYGSRGASRQRNEDDDFGYVSDVPPQTVRPAPSAPSSASVSSTASPAKSYAFSRKTPAGKYAVGMVVEHKKYGLGTVTSVSSNGAVIRVTFREKGVVELSAAYAPLTIVSKPL